MKNSLNIDCEIDIEREQYTLLFYAHCDTGRLIHFDKITIPISKGIAAEVIVTFEGIEICTEPIPYEIQDALEECFFDKIS
jgi:hypothetical protein